MVFEFAGPLVGGARGAADLLVLVEAAGAAEAVGFQVVELPVAVEAVGLLVVKVQTGAEVVGLLVVGSPAEAVDLLVAGVFWVVEDLAEVADLLSEGVRAEDELLFVEVLTAVEVVGPRIGGPLKYADLRTLVEEVLGAEVEAVGLLVEGVLIAEVELAGLLVGGARKGANLLVLVQEVVGPPFVGILLALEAAGLLVGGVLVAEVGAVGLLVGGALKDADHLALVGEVQVAEVVGFLTGGS